MTLLGLKTFRHGVHPPESKDETSGLAIRQFPFAPVLIVPLIQHMGKPSIAEVVESSVRVHLRSDVPWCSLLSGGLDSSGGVAQRWRRHGSGQQQGQGPTAQSTQQHSTETKRCPFLLSTAHTTFLFK